MDKAAKPDSELTRDPHAIVSDSPDADAAGDIAAGDAPLVIDGGVVFNMNDNLRPDNTIIINQQGGDNSICPICNLNVRDDGVFFSCAHCRAKPIHDKCGDVELTLCRSCLEAFARREKLRERCSPLLLSVKAGGETLSFFLFAKSTLQFGRAKQKYLEKVSPPRGHHYVPRDNDIITGVLDSAGNILKGPSQCISGRHFVLRVLEYHNKERLKAYDCGTEGKGSSCGTWIGNDVLPKARWTDFPDDGELCMGKSPDLLHRGLVLETAVHRNIQDENRIDCVLIKRKDALRSHHYVLVYRTAYLGLGKCALSLGENQPTVPWGEVQYDENSSSFIYKAFPQSPLTSEPSSPCRLTPETVITGGDFKISVSHVAEATFTE